MEPTSQENDKLEIPIGTTPKGGQLVVVPTQTGLYRIEYRGEGASPKITQQLFTSLILAKRAMDNYYRANVALYAKEKLKERIATGPSIKEQRKAEALALKNGELEKPELDDEE